MDQILVVIPTEGAGVMVLLFPEVQVCIVGKDVMSSIQGKLELLVWESLYCFCPDSWHIRWEESNHVTLSRETQELGQLCTIIFCHTLFAATLSAFLERDGSCCMVSRTVIAGRNFFCCTSSSE